MGCSNSKLDDEEVVRICSERKKFIKQAIQQRNLFATGHVSYIQALKRVSVALHEFAEGEESHGGFLFHLTPTKTGPETITLNLKPLSQSPAKQESVINYLKSGMYSSVFVEEKPQSPEVFKIESYSPLHCQQGGDNFFKHATVRSYLKAGMSSSVFIEERPQSPEIFKVESYSPFHYEHGGADFFKLETDCLKASVSSSSVSMGAPPSPEVLKFGSYSPLHHQHGGDDFLNTQYPLYSTFFGSPYSKPGPPLPSPPRTSQWDFFWNPFSSLDSSYMYHSQCSPSRTTDDEIRGLKKVREEEGIPDLEDETDESRNKEAPEEENLTSELPHRDESHANAASSSAEPSDKISVTMNDIVFEFGNDDDKDETLSQSKIEVSKLRNSMEHGVTSSQDPTKTETVVYFNHGPPNFSEIIKNIENQFMIACDYANEVSMMLETSKAHQSTASNDLTAVKILNPIALIRSASSRSSSSRTFQASSTSRDDDCDSISTFPEEHCMLSGSHRSTLDRLYAWEKKLYEEVKAGERIRITYEKKCKQFKEHDLKGDDPSMVDKTRLTIRDLLNRIRVSLQSVEYVSRRIEALRDEELQPQLMELIQGLARMWRGMTECHQAQKQIMLEATQHTLIPWVPLGVPVESHQRATAKLEAELVNWRTAFTNWVEAQRAYVRALVGWVLNCLRLQIDDSFKLPESPQGIGPPPIVSITSRWASVFDGSPETLAIDMLRGFLTNIRALYDQQCENLKQSRRSNQVVKNLENKWQMAIHLLDQPDPELLSESGAAIREQEWAVEELRKQLEEERERQRQLTERTTETAVDVVCSGLSSVVDAVTEFAVKSAEGYNELEKVCEKMRQIANGRSNGQLTA